MYSGALSGTYKTPEMAQSQFDEVCQVFQIDPSSSMEEILASLRKIDAAELTSKLRGLEAHSFRPTTDGDFVSRDLVKRLQDGSFAACFRKRHFRLLIGEVEHEESLYRLVDPPTCEDDFILQLRKFYSDDMASNLAKHNPFPPSKDVLDQEHWMDHHGYIVAGSQVRASTRSLVSRLPGPPDVLRYRISYRPKHYTTMPESMGVTHGMCQIIWWFQACLDMEERRLIKQWLSPWKDFIHGNTSDWGTQHMTQFRHLTADGRITIQEDPTWSEYLTFAKVLMPDHVFL